MSEFVNGGDTGKITRDYLDSLLLEMRHFDAVEPSTNLTLYGESFSTPVMSAALSHLDNTRTNGAVETAKGVFAAGGVMWTGMGEESELEAIIATGAKTIKIIKPHADNNIILKKMEHAERCGALAVGIDIDHAFGGINERGSCVGFPLLPKSLDEIKGFVRATKLPFIIKGVLSEQDALKCLEAGVRGIVLSHHHGMLDYALPPLQIAPKIAKLIQKKIPIFADCGFIRGIDIFKALALGVTAVSIGRPLMGPLKENGAAGVQKVIENFTHELNWAMAMTCSPDLEHIDPSVVWRSGSDKNIL